MLGADQVRWLVRLGVEYDNLHAALAWSLEHDPALGLRLAASLWQFWRVRLFLSEGRQWLEQLLAVVRRRRQSGSGPWRRPACSPTGSSTRRRHARATRRASSWRGRSETGRCWAGSCAKLGTVIARLGDHDRAQSLFEEGLALSRAADDRRNVAPNLMHQGRLATFEGDYRRAQRLLDESAALLSEVGDRWQLSLVLEDAGGIAVVVGEPERAEALFAASIEAGREIAAAGFGAIHRPHHPGVVAFWRGDAEQPSAGWYEELLATTRANDHTSGIVENLLGLGQAVLLQGDVARATALLEEGLRLSTAHANESGRALALYGLGLVARNTRRRAARDRPAAREPGSAAEAS